jgi:hypothetical protein
MSTTDDSIKVVAPDELTVHEVEEALDGVGELPVGKKAPTTKREKAPVSPHGWTNPGSPPPGR